ncbi:MAG: MinD/ParA family protein [Anaerolineaceae bacterium]|jgi:MinD-like ATPase involved in chromosome partitioning or flagellar assembly|nr:MAG: MinD/ParA family protein [Anaerolineaceae bacterium]
MKGKIVSIHSFRGGTGKSNTTANLAAQVAMAGKRVGVVDTDIQSPGIHVLFGLDEDKMGKTLNDFLHDKATIREIGFPIGENASGAAGRAKLAGKNLWLFPSSIRGREISQILKEGIDFNRLNEGLQSTIKEFDLDYLFIDTHPGLNEETLLSIATSDILIIILRPDQQDLQGTSVTVDIARSLDVPNLILMVNKALPKYDFVELRKDIESKFNAPVAGILPLSFDLADNASNDLFSLSTPDHEWSRSLREVAQAVLTLG